MFLDSGAYSLIDSGASADVCGLAAAEAERRELEKLGLQPVQLKREPKVINGVGGVSTSIGSWLVPAISLPRYGEWWRRPS